MKIQNRKAHFNYNILETMEVGIVLNGPEVKSVREGRVDFSDSFARIQNGEVYLKNAFIPPYKGGVPEGYNPKRDRKLLLHRKQIDELILKTAKASVTLVPISVYQTRNMFKVELGLAQSKRQYDKRRAIKARDEQRRIQQEIKY